MKKKLLNSEQETIKTFFAEYNKFHSLLEELQIKIDAIDAEKTKILNEINQISDSLEQLRVRESEFRSQMKSKYGDFYVDLETFEISLTNYVNNSDSER